MEVKGFNPIYDDNKKEGKIYLGKKKVKADGSSYRKVEMLFSSDYSLSEQIVEGEEEVYIIKDEIILRKTESGQQKIHCWLMENADKNSKSIVAIRISRRTAKGLYGSEEITLLSNEVKLVQRFFDKLFNLTIEDFSGINLASETDSIDTIYNSEKIIQLIKNNIKSEDDIYEWLELKHKKQAISRLEDIINGGFKNEVEITTFLNKNIWMFGREYAIFSDVTIINKRNILDLSPFTIDSFIDIIEVKLPEVKLFNFDSSHNNYYPTSNLTKAIAQTQNYIYEFETNFSHIKNKDDNKVIRPFATILIGGKIDLCEDKKKALRILNASYHNIRVITYQDLLNYAKQLIKIQDR